MKETMKRVCVGLLAHVVYTKESQTADAYIEKATYEIGRGHRVRVATSDGAEQLIIWGHGALRVSASAFHEEVTQVGGQIAAILDRNNRPESRQPVRAAMAEVRSAFRPEFLNRLDEIILFRPLTRENLTGIIEILMKGLRARLAEKTLTLEVTDAARDLLIDRGFDPVYGARPLKRYLQSAAETLIAKEILKGELPAGSTLVLDAENGTLTCRKKSA